MAIKYRVEAVSKWVLRDNTWEVDIISALPVDVAVSDVTGQVDGSIEPNVLVVEIENLTAAQLTAIKANSKIEVISEEQYQDVDGSVAVTDKKDTLNAGQLNALKNRIKAKFGTITDGELDMRGSNKKEMLDTFRAKLKTLPKKVT